MLLTPGNVQLQYGQRSSTFFAMPTDTISLKSYENLNLRSTTTAKKKNNLRFAGKSAPCTCGSQTRPRLTKSARTGPERDIPRTPAPPQCRHINVFYIRSHFMYLFSLRCSQVWANLSCAPEHAALILFPPFLRAARADQDGGQTTSNKTGTSVPNKESAHDIAAAAPAAELGLATMRSQQVKENFSNSLNDIDAR